MEIEIKKGKKCFSKEHLNIDATSYCPICRIYMCNKCETTHENFIKENHKIYKLENDINDIFTGFCKKEKHPNQLIYFCKTHNELCCANCIAKIDEKGDGQHKDCDICIIEKIKDSKMSNLDANIKKLEDLSKTIDNSIKDMKNLSEKIEKRKDDIKIKVQQIFTQLRTELNNREDKLLIDIDNQFNKLYFNEDLIKISEKLPKRIKILLEKGKEINKEWKDENSNFLINDCINIEKALDNINEIKWKIEKSNLNIDTKILFKPDENGINDIVNSIKNFGEIYSDNFKYSFRQCPLNIKEERKYEITGEKKNILTNITGSWTGTMCENELDKSIEEHKWKIKILKSQNKSIMVGVAPIDFDFNSSDYNTCGWYYYCHPSCPYLFQGHLINIIIKI